MKSKQTLINISFCILFIILTLFTISAVTWSFDLSTATNKSDGFTALTFAGGAIQIVGTVFNNSDFWFVDASDDAIFHTNRSGYNMTDGFALTDTAGTTVNPVGMCGNSTDLYVLDATNLFIHHLLRGNNQSDGFELPTGIANPNGLACNKSNLWILDTGDKSINQTDKSGVIVGSGIDVTISGAGSAVIRALASNDSDFWFVDDDDAFVYHLNRNGVNQTDGFIVSGIGSSGPYSMTGSPFGFYIADVVDDFIYHYGIDWYWIPPEDTYPTITLDVPADAASYTTSLIFFNCTATDEGKIENLSLFINGIRNYTVINGINNFSNISINRSLSVGKYNWTCDAYDNATIPQHSVASNRSLSVSVFTETANKFNHSVLETSTNYYSLNISATSSVSSVSSILWYNETGYTSTTMDGAGGVYHSYNVLDVHLANNQSENKSFWWEFTLLLVDGSTVKQNSTHYSQEVNQTFLGYCNDTFTTPFINYTTKKSENPFPKLNATLKYVSHHWIGTGDIKRNYSFENLTETVHNWSFCGSHNMSFQVDTTIEYDALNYAKNFYYLSNATLSNETNAINLYLLNDSESTITVLKVENEAQNPIADATIQIQLYDIGTDTFYTVAMAKTSYNGEDLAYLNWYSTLYKFIISKDGEILQSTDPYKISETPQIFSIASDLAFSFDKFRDFEYSLIYNNATKNFVLTFTKPSGLVDEGCLRVIKRSSKNDTQICLTCETSSSATVYCNIDGYGNGTFIGSFYATGSWYPIDWISTTIGASFAETIYELLGNADATAYAFLFSGITVSMFFISPIFAIVGLVLGILGGAALGFTLLNYAEFVGIVIAGGVIIWIVKR